MAVLVVQGHPSPPCQMVKPSLDMGVEEEYQDLQVVGVVVPSQVMVEAVVVLACQGGVEAVGVLACQGEAEAVGVLACQVKGVEVEEVEYQHDPVKEEPAGLGEQLSLHALVEVVEVEVEAYLHFGLAVEGEVAEGEIQVLAQER